MKLFGHIFIRSGGSLKGAVLVCLDHQKFSVGPDGPCLGRSNHDRKGLSEDGPI